MKITMVIPSYWGREECVGWKKGDDIYDHPTPIDSEGTLLRAIQSIKKLEDKDFQLVIIAVATTEDIEKQVEKKIANIIKSSNPGVEVLLFKRSHLEQIHKLLVEEGKKQYIDILQVRGYSNIRNLCVFIPHILGSEAAVLIDDDEVFEDPEFMSKAKEFINKNNVSAIAGYYLQPDNDYRVKKPFRPWMTYWDKYDRMNEAFDKIIGTEPRLKETPFVFGGNMVIHKNLFTVVPFDPKISRGEDIDFLINAKMFGFSFFLDNQLSIKHLPPSNTQPVWAQLREDIYRFIYERAKIEEQKDIKGMDRVCADDFDPYPGCFLKENLEEKIEKASQLLSEEYLANGDAKGSKEALDNIAIAKSAAKPKYDAFQGLRELQKHWKEFMLFTSQEKIRAEIKNIICKKI
jgi:glycosyltransferase involved in cell wall biosynthesis